MNAHRWTTLAPLAVLLALGVAACGDEGSDGPQSADESTPTASDSPKSDLPDCDSVWQEGADLPANYRGCSADGEAVAPKIVDCSSGQRIVTYDDHYWAVRGHVIGYAEQGLANDKKYAGILYSCRA
jgi:hypothetical protein